MGAFSFSGSMERNDRKFRAKIHKIAEEIKKESNGKVCGDCKEYCQDYCLAADSITGHGSLSCQSTAIACKFFEPKFIPEVTYASMVLQQLDELALLNPPSFKRKYRRKVSQFQMSFSFLYTEMTF
jgi:hypothetical protein